MLTVILDTNFLIYCAKYKIDYEAEIDRLFNEKYDVIITDQILDEFEELSENRLGKEKAVIELAKSIVDVKIKNNKIKLKEVLADDADYSIIKIASQAKKAIIATLDKELENEAIKRLKNIQFLTIKQKTHLSLV